MKVSDFILFAPKADLTKAETGKYGEKLASRHLKKNGWKIAGTNVRAGNSEIDIIAVKDETLIFAEVKTRTYSKEALSRPADSVTKEKMTYLIRGATRFLAENPSEYASFYKRFDIIEVYLEKRDGRTVCKEIKHFENAFGR